MVNSNFAYKNRSIPELEVVINDSPFKWCSVSLSDVVSRGKRLEASVFDVEAKQARNLITHGKYPVVTVCGNSGLASSYVCGRFKRIWVKKSELPIYQPSTITDINPVPDGYISKKTKTNIEALRVHKGQVLMTCSGTIGKVSYVSATLDKKIFSHDLLRINCLRAEDAGYVYAYLKSKVGRKILLTNSYGAVITHIEPEHLTTVPIPDAPIEIRKTINNLITRSFDLRDESNALIDRATDLLIKELHLPDLSAFDVDLYKKDASVDTFNVRLSNMSCRLDASYHVPIADAIIEYFKKYAEEVTTVGDIRVSKKIILAGVFKRTYVDANYGYPFLGGKEITQLSPVTEKYLSKAIHKKRYEKELKVEENTILVTDRGSIGISAMVPKHWNDYAVSQNVLKVIPSTNEIAGYLFVYLNSEYGNALVRRQTYGSVVDMIDNKSLSNVEIPLLKNHKVQKQINDFALEANKMRYEAHKLEQEALRIMDAEVIYSR